MYVFLKAQPLLQLGVGEFPWPPLCRLLSCWLRTFIINCLTEIHTLSKIFQSLRHILLPRRQAQNYLVAHLKPSSLLLERLFSLIVDFFDLIDVKRLHCHFQGIHGCFLQLTHTTRFTRIWLVQKWREIRPMETNHCACGRCTRRTWQDSRGCTLLQEYCYSTGLLRVMAP